MQTPRTINTRAHARARADPVAINELALTRGIALQNTSQ